MANTTYESLLGEVIPMVPGCPDLLIESAIRSAAIELCEKAGVYKKELDVITTTANIYEYDLEPPSGTAVHKINWVTHKGIDLEPLSTALLEVRKPKWREAAYAGTPEYFVKITQSLGGDFTLYVNGKYQNSVQIKNAIPYGVRGTRRRQGAVIDCGTSG